MTDLEFYKKALVYQSYLTNRIAEIKAYGSHWSDEFCLDEIKKAIKKYYLDKDVANLFSIDNLTVERAKALRFCQWSDEQPDLYLFPLWFVLFVPYGTKVIGIGGDTFEYTKDTDLDTRFGCVAFGIELKQQFMEEMWLARDKDGELIMYEREPLKDKLAEQWTLGGQFGFLPENWFPNVLWSDEEPTKVKLVIDK